MPHPQTTSELAVHIAVAAVVTEGRVLLVHRHPSRENYPDCWDLPGGHVEPGESSEAAVRRELLEELGVTVLDVQPIPLPRSNSAILQSAYLVSSWTGTPRDLPQTGRRPAPTAACA